MDIGNTKHRHSIILERSMRHHATLNIIEIMLSSNCIPMYQFLSVKKSEPS
jgi:hypothetical protein